MPLFPRGSLLVGLVSTISLALTIGCTATRSPVAADRGSTATKARLTFLALDRHGALLQDTANHLLLGYRRTGRHLSLTWRRQVDPEKLFDAACARQCPNAVLQLPNTNSPNTFGVEFIYDGGRPQSGVAPAVGERDSLIHVFRWDDRIAVFSRQREQQIELVVRNRAHETVLALDSPHTVVRSSADGRSLVVSDQSTTAILTVTGDQSWKVAWQQRQPPSAVCVSSTGRWVLVSAGQDLLWSTHAGFGRRLSAPLPRVGACALSRSRIVEGKLYAVNGKPNSEWVARDHHGRVLWSKKFPQLGDAIISESDDITCLVLDEPICLDRSGMAVPSVHAPLALDYDGSIVFLDKTGDLLPVPSS